MNNEYNLRKRVEIMKIGLEDRLLLKKASKQSMKLVQQSVMEVKIKHLPKQKINGRTLLRNAAKRTVCFVVHGAIQRDTTKICSRFLVRFLILVVLCS